MLIMSKTLNVDMRVYSDIELEMFAKELTDALNHIEYLSEPEEEYSEFADIIDITKSPIFFGYTESVRKSIDRILNTIYTEQELRSTLREELMKKLDAYSISQLTDIFFTVSTDIAQHKDLLEMLSEEDGTLFKKDTENYIEKQERYLKLITDVIKKRNAEAPQGGNSGSGGSESGNNSDNNGTGGNNSSGGESNTGNSGSGTDVPNNGGSEGTSDSGTQNQGTNTETGTNNSNENNQQNTNQGTQSEIPSGSSGGITSSNPNANGTNTTPMTGLSSPLSSGNPNYGLNYDDPDAQAEGNNN